mmetsp:Transcript_31812/g.66398  ORF Transcript_31812/g.66398 Transcript_31812/m.66398 type:complete len:149 (-) Transcript_31812:191-637(-)
MDGLLIAEAKLKMVTYLVAQPSVDVNAQDHNGDTPLHLACQQEYEAVAEYLLDHCRSRIMTSVVNKKGLTPLMVAAESEKTNVNMVYILLCATMGSTNGSLFGRPHPPSQTADAGDCAAAESNEETAGPPVDQEEAAVSSGRKRKATD